MITHRVVDCNDADYHCFSIPLWISDPSILGLTKKLGLSLYSLPFIISLLFILQFRALSDQIYRTTEHHELVREQVVGQVGIFAY